MVNLGAFNPFGSSVKASSEIVDLRIYPVKSCRGISLKSSTVTHLGLDLDRRWMFVNTAKNNQFVTIREISEMTLIDTAFVSSLDRDANGSEDDLELTLSIRGQTGKSVSVPARPTQEWLEQHTTHAEVSIWGGETDGYMYGDEVNRIFVDFLGAPVALVYKGPQARICVGNGAPQHLGRQQSVNFPDMMPILVANLASIAELNGRLRVKGQREITVERFRPNIIVSGGDEVGMAAWTEDVWKTLRITDPRQQQEQQSTGFFGSWTAPAVPSLELDVPVRCARCQVPNVDPDTGEKNKKEPWDTLVSYRRVDEGIKYKPCFGMLCAPRNEGPIRVGMVLEVTETTQNHKFIKP